MCVHISWQVKNIGEKPRSNMVNQRTLTHAHQEALHSSLFVSYLYNYFKVSTDFGFPFREKTIKPCSPGLSGGSVRIISLHGAVAGTAAPRAHTALRASNLRLKTSNFTLFHQQRWTFLGALWRSTYKTPPSLSSTSSTTALLAVYRRSVPKLFIFSPFKEILLAP